MGIACMNIIQTSEPNKEIQHRWKRVKSRTALSGQRKALTCPINDQISVPDILIEVHALYCHVQTNTVEETGDVVAGHQSGSV